MEGILTAYDLNFYSLLQTLTETKSCTSYAIHENEKLICVIIGRRIIVYQRIDNNFIILNDIPTSETPRAITYTSTSLIVGYKRHYEVMDLHLNSAIRILDFEKEHRMICFEVYYYNNYLLNHKFDILINYILNVFFLYLLYLSGSFHHPKIVNINERDYSHFPQEQMQPLYTYQFLPQQRYHNLNLLLFLMKNLNGHPCPSLASLIRAKPLF